MKQGEDYVLFCLDGVGRGHIVAGDITTLSCRKGTSEPPVPFSVTRRETHRERARESAVNRHQTEANATFLGLMIGWFTPN